MSRTLLLFLVFLVQPMGAVAAAGAQSAVSTVPAFSSGNVYVAGTSVVLTKPVTGDFSACAGSIVTASPVAGDALLLAGSINSRARVSGDFRALAGNIDIYEPISGDIFAAGFSIRDSNHVGGSVLIVAENAALTGGASGPVTIYGNNVSLEGDFAQDVHIVAGGHLAIAPNTIIHGKLSYEAPEAASIPATATILGGVTYTNASYLPDAGTSRVLALVSLGFFLVVRIIGALILAGLLAGLFPNFAEMVIEKVFSSRRRDLLLTLMLGFAVVIVTPVVILLLLLTFVGVGLAFLLGILYALLLLLAFLYSGIVLGGLCSRRFLKRRFVVWHDGVLGMFILSFVALLPFVGLPIVFLLAFFFAGMLLKVFFQVAFPHKESEPEYEQR